MTQMWVQKDISSAVQVLTNHYKNVVFDVGENSKSLPNEGYPKVWIPFIAKNFHFIAILHLLKLVAFNFFYLLVLFMFKSFIVFISFLSPSSYLLREYLFLSLVLLLLILFSFLFFCGVRSIIRNCTDDCRKTHGRPYKAFGWLWLPFAFELIVHLFQPCV